MSGDPIAQPAGDFVLQAFDLGTAELDHVAGFQVDQVVMVLSSRGLIAGATITELVALKDAFRLQPSNGAVDRC